MLAVVVGRPAVTVAATIAVIAVLMMLGGLALQGRVPDAVGHAASHAFVGIPVALLVAAAVRWWPPARRTAPGRLARWMTVSGLTGIVVGQVLEIAGARVGEPGATYVEGLLHTAGQIVTNLALLAAVAGGMLALVAAVREGVIPRWIAVVVAVVVAVALMFLIVGAPGD